MNTELNILLVSDNQKSKNLVSGIIKQVKFLNLHVAFTDGKKKSLSTLASKEFDIYIFNTGIDNSLITQFGDILSKTGNLNALLLLSNKKVVELPKYIDDVILMDDLNPSLLGKAIQYNYLKNKFTQELEASEKKYKQLYLNSATSVIQINNEFKVIEANQTFIQTFGYSPAYNLTNNLPYIWDFIGCPDSQSDLKEQILSKPSGLGVTFNCKTQLNEELQVKLSIYKLEENNEVSYQVVFVDLTEEINRNEEERQRQKLDLMEKMARIVAHEVRNPLNNILLAEGQLRLEIDSSLEIYTDIIERNANRIEDLIRKFLNTFKSIELKFETVYPEPFLKNCLKSFTDKASLLEVEVQLSVSSKISKVTLDPDKIQLVISNLLTNAFKAVHNTTKPQIQLSCLQKNNNIIISVKDNGIGFENQNPKEFFEPFYTSSNNGLGLGLTTSLNIIRAHFGSISPSENEEGGATFSISLPLEPLRNIT